MSVKGERWLLIAASSRDAAEDYAARRGIRSALTLDRRDLLKPPWRLRAQMSAARPDRAAIHSLDWARERAPQLAELALGLAPVRSRLLIDEGTGTTQDRGRLLAPTAARLPIELVGAGALAGREAIRLSRTSPAEPARLRSSHPPHRVLAIWPGSSGEVGGAVTHMSGILAAFKGAGLSVGLASAGRVPAQLAASVDEVEIAASPSRAARLSKDTEQLTVNLELLRAAERLSSRFEPDFVYQRHRAFLLAGARLAPKLGVPLVLEWNSSEAWKRRNWDRPLLRLPPLERLVASTERRSLNAAAIVAGVSAQAAAMATEAGADRQRVRVVPNGVDIANVEEALKRCATGPRLTGDLVGWIGSFGPWHGAPVLVRALPHLPPEVRLRMIGDGQGRPAVQALARDLGLAERIEWSGALPHAEALESLAQCDLLASPHVPASDSPFFGSPTKLFEYMALGRPIVASRLEQIGEVLDHDRTALLVEPGDERSLAAAIARVLERPDRGASLGRAAAREARQLHTWDRRAGDLIEALAR